MIAVQLIPTNYIKMQISDSYSAIHFKGEKKIIIKFVIKFRKFPFPPLLDIYLWFFYENLDKDNVIYEVNNTSH